MSRMSDIFIEIQGLLVQGIDPSRVAKMLQVPTRWVFHTLETMKADYHEFDPYNTINS